MKWILVSEETPPNGQYVLVCTKNLLNPDWGFAIVEFNTERGCWIETFANLLDSDRDVVGRHDAKFIVCDIPKGEFTHWTPLIDPEGKVAV